VHGSRGAVVPALVDVVEDAGQCIHELNGGLGIYKVGTRTVKPALGDGTGTYEAFRRLFAPDATDLVKSKIILIEYSTTDLEADDILAKVTAHVETFGVPFDVTLAPGCVSAFLFKDNYTKLRTHLQLGDLRPSAVLRLVNPGGTGAKAARQKQLDAFVARDALPTERVASMCVKGAADTEDTHWTWEQAVQYVHQVTEQSWTSLIANAEGKKKAKLALSTAERNLLVYKGRLEMHLRPRFEASMLVRVAATVTPTIGEYPDAVKQLVTLDFNHVTGKVEKDTLQNIMNGTKCLKKAIFLIGDAGAGKDYLLNALAALNCKRCDLATFMVSDALDPYGAATKAGLTGQQGAFVCNDGELKSTLHGRLSAEEVKKLFNVEQVGTYNARYGTAQLPQGIPRLFSVNSSLAVVGGLGTQPTESVGSVNYAAWFEKEGIGYVKHLLDEKADAILKLGAAERAVVRRIVVVKVPGRLFSVSATGSFESDLRHQVAQRVAAVPW
jgi:hypothetical protein